MNLQNIAILGGGISALSTALELTSAADWQQHYTVTVYTLGWRLGGKGASSRGSDFRIEEHGLHVWFGFYENAFTQMRCCYEELGRPPGTPLSIPLPDPEYPGAEAFSPLQYTVNADFHFDSWHNWKVIFEKPNTDSKPGYGDPYPSWLERLERALHWMHEAMTTFLDDGHGLADNAIDFTTEEPLYKDLETTLDVTLDDIKHVPPFYVLAYTERLAARLDVHRLDTTTQTFGGIIWLLEKLRDLLHRNEPRAKTSDKYFRSYVSADMVLTTLLVLLKNDVVNKGYDQLDDRDIKTVMCCAGLSQIALDSSVMRGMYDSSFAFLHGAPTKDAEVMAAGAALKNGNRMMFGYKGAFVWLMQAGMGETVFIPYYEVLKKRGVHFEFFCDVRELNLSDDGQRIASVSYRRQATLKNPSTGYEPRADKDGFAYWPPHPNYDQLNEGDEMRRRADAGENVNLESYWTAWAGVRNDQEQDGNDRLIAGKDFDTLVLAIPIQSLMGTRNEPGICHALIAASDKWRGMQEVQTDRTMAAQLWMKPDLAGLGWCMDFDGDGKPDQMLLTSYVRPLGTWAIMDHLLPREGWSQCPPRHLAYFCGPMSDCDQPDAPRGDHDFPQRAWYWLKGFARQYFAENMPVLWPRDKPWNPDLVRDEFYRVNIDPSERYTLSVAGTTGKRLRANESQFDNLVLAGDWIRTGLNAGCIEAAVMSGMQASRAISRHPKIVIGEEDTDIAR